MEKINIAEILKDCPKGMELDCTIYDNVKLIGVDEICITPFPIRVSRGDGYTMTLTKYGQYADADFAKCIIFPKGKTTWEGFVPPCKFKDGDVLANPSSMGTWIGIYHRHDYMDETFSSYMSIRRDGKFCPDPICGHGYYETRLANKEEKEKLFKAIKDNGYRWNAETKTLEKLIVPKFKVGDRIKSIISQLVYPIKEVRENAYLVEEKTGCFFVPFCLERNYELVPNKFDISNLVPFESRVLVRDYDNRIWIPTFWGKHLENDSNYSYLTTNGFYKYCIPYENNEPLLGTSKDCDEYYKTWG